MDDDPLSLSIKIVLENRYQSRAFVENLIYYEVDDIAEGLREIKANISRSTSSKRVLYKEINPTLSSHPLYKAETHVREHLRVAFTRFRVSSHSLAVEVGRWNRRGRGRLPLEERLCVCGQIQTEVHVTQYCTLTQHLRNTYNFSTIQDLFSDKYDDTQRCDIVHKILGTYTT